VNLQESEVTVLRISLSNTLREKIMTSKEQVLIESQTARTAQLAQIEDRAE
jgi:hypothetical protein